MSGVKATTPVPRLPRLIHMPAVQIRYLRQRDGDLCHLCGKAMTFDRGSNLSATRDHVIPKSKGGGNVMTNFRLAHKLCNERRGNATVVEYAEREALTALIAGLTNPAALKVLWAAMCSMTRDVHCPQDNLSAEEWAVADRIFVQLDGVQNANR